jgi:hypothetical protein
MRQSRVIHALVVVGLVLLGPITQPAQAAEVPAELAGKYRCEGEDFSGDTYSGEVTITKHGDTYLIEWDVTFKKAGRSKYVGVGLLTDTILSASWEGQDKAGVMVYKVDKSGDLAGRWTIRGNKETRAEKLTRIKR